MHFRESKAAPLWWQWVHKSIYMRFDPLAQSMTWGVTESWLRDQPWRWHLPKKKHHSRIIRRSWMIRLRWCLNFVSAATFGRVKSQKPNPDLRVIYLTSEVTDLPGPQIWSPIAASRNGRHARLFCEALAQLEAKWQGDRPPFGRDVHMKKIATSNGG